MFSIKPKIKGYPSTILSNCCVRRGECVCSHCHYHNPDSALAQDYIAKLWDRKNKERNEIRIQSGEDLNVSVSDNKEEVEQNVEFTDSAIQYDLMIGERVLDETYTMAKVGEADDLSKFLERPVRIFNKFWEVGESPIYVNTINPWSLFLNNDKVKNKLETFKLLN